ncbi:MAG: hypothetical protein DMG03_04885 [Acidobacteria bacterium]|nr:MAG: hypothetical protein DMG03_04885 [Acidobacteriota bacterium]
MSTAAPNIMALRIPGKIVASAIGSREMLRPLFDSGYACSRPLAIALKLASACSRVTAAFKRPTVLKTTDPRS